MYAHYRVWAVISGAGVSEMCLCLSTQFMPLHYIHSYPLSYYVPLNKWLLHLLHPPHPRLRVSTYDWAYVCMTTSSLKPPWHHWVLFAACAKPSRGQKTEALSLIYHQWLRLSAKQSCLFIMSGIRWEENKWKKIVCGCQDILTCLFLCFF